jgi:hypothetical protein
VNEAASEGQLFGDLDKEMKMRRPEASSYLITIVGVVVLSPFGCGGSPNASPTAYCNSTCAWDIKCKRTNHTQETCVSDCSKGFVNESVYRTDVLGAVKDCFDSLACGKNDDECNATALFNQGLTDSDAKALYDSCRSRYTGCNLVGKEDPVDLACAYVLMVTSATREAIKTCLAGDCPERLDRWIAFECGRSLLGNIFESPSVRGFGQRGSRREKQRNGDQKGRKRSR